MPYSSARWTRRLTGKGLGRTVLTVTATQHHHGRATMYKLFGILNGPWTGNFEEFTAGVKEHAT
jgi:hypothetical protein